ncbi:FimV family protein [Halopseudomonas phragmitis]|uniref:FimV N-terminal domain-containing protein n=1 Tax=Halopseudomonas phragmitis TaxID=1931241 RepID=A0A1V0B7J7_9GAMM|nr:FimV/HubP family polar landmark protein [Halopseudomonas phragmitis]AQZ95908.1 hypothetical protein BVH74_14610 [Halopseudomonas phragmitis]
MPAKHRVVLGVATVAALYAGISNALGLGDIALGSALNEPLKATIELHGSSGVTPEDIRVRLADQQAFDQAGIQRPYFLTDLRFVPVLRNNRLFIDVESNWPVREPYLNFLVELRRPNGVMLREYTVLLDPPLYSPGPGISQPVAAAAQTRSSVQTPVSRPVQPAPAALALPDLQPQPGAAQYQTVAGDTLWAIAERYRPDERAGVRQTMLAIRALNPQAFIDGDINRLRQGQALVLPTAEQLGFSAAPPAQRPLDSQPESIATVAEPVASADRLRIDALEPAANESAELRDRLSMLETRFSVLLSELDNRDSQIASLQAELEVLREARALEQAAFEESAAAGALLAVAGAEPGAQSSVQGSDDPNPGALGVLPAAGLMDDRLGAQVTSSSLERWFSWWPILVGLGLAVLGLLFGMRKKSSAESESIPMPPIRPREQVAPGSVRVRQPAPAQPKPATDPLAGVELYITYGRFAEARVLLDKAIATQPERLDLRYRLLRVLAELCDRPAFAAQEREALALGADMERIDQLKMRFPALLAQVETDMVERVDHLDPLLMDDELEQPSRTPRAAEQEAQDDVRLNLEDFKLDLDVDLLDALGPQPVRSKQPPKAVDDDFDVSLDDLPDVEEWEHDEPHKSERR